MADGKGMRWGNHMGIPKHLVSVGGEGLIKRTVNILNSMKSVYALELIVTSHDARYEFDGCKRHEPINNKYEIDRFTKELIEDDMCFLYGDTYYTEETINKILGARVEDILFFGNRKSIVAVKIRQSEIFKSHVDNVRRLYLLGELDRCVGWQVYQSFTGQAFDSPILLDRNFVFVDDRTRDINTPKDYEMIVS